jgi:hypothetical protein
MIMTGNNNYDIIFCFCILLDFIHLASIQTRQAMLCRGQLSTVYIITGSNEGVINPDNPDIPESYSVQILRETPLCHAP